MAKTWVLDTETKGTGAHVSPLADKPKPAAEPALALVDLGRTPSPAKEPTPVAPLKFKVVDVMSARVLVEDADARTVVELLAGFNSVVDARIYVWNVEGIRWRLLSLGEQKALWRFRQQRTTP